MNQVHAVIVVLALGSALADATFAQGTMTKPMQDSTSPPGETSKGTGRMTTRPTLKKGHPADRPIDQLNTESLNDAQTGKELHPKASQK